MSIGCSAATVAYEQPMCAHRSQRDRMNCSCVSDCGGIKIDSNETIPAFWFNRCFDISDSQPRNEERVLRFAVDRMVRYNNNDCRNRLVRQLLGWILNIFQWSRWTVCRFHRLQNARIKSNWNKKFSNVPRTKSTLKIVPVFDWIRLRFSFVFIFIRKWRK